MKTIVFLIFAFVTSVANAQPVAVYGINSRSGYWNYSSRPGGTPTLMAGPIFNGSVGDTSDDTPKRVGLVLSFDSNDEFRAIASSPNSRFFLKLVRNSLVGGGAPSHVQVELLDSARNWNAENFVDSNPEWAWIRPRTLAVVANPLASLVDNSEVIVEITNVIKPYVNTMDWSKSGIVFGIFALTPSDNNTANGIRFSIEQCSVSVVSDIPLPLPNVSIRTGITIGVQTQTGRIYILETSEDLGVWRSTGIAFTGDGTFREFSQPITDGASYFRFVVLP